MVMMLMVRKTHLDFSSIILKCLSHSPRQSAHIENQMLENSTRDPSSSFVLSILILVLHPFAKFHYPKGLNGTVPIFLLFAFMFFSYLAKRGLIFLSNQQLSFYAAGRYMKSQKREQEENGPEESQMMFVLLYSG